MSDKTVQVLLPPKLIPVFTGEARYRGAYGGRGSGKTRTFAKMAAIKGYQLSKIGQKGLIVGAREFMNSLNESSLAEIKATILSEPWLADHYEIGEKYVRTKDGRISFDFIGLRHNLDSVKSKARIHLLWIDEAEPVSEEAWIKITPTVREHNSEIWVTWNPESRKSATHKRFRENPPENAKIVELNWQDNPWFPDVLNVERLNDLQNRPEQYEHIWGGDFVSVVDGAYFASALVNAKNEGRISNVAADPLMSLKAFWDIGGTGARADATAIWIAQFIGREIRVIDYYEAQGQPLAAHVNWLRENGYGQADMFLPHDGATKDRIHDVSFESALREAGFNVEVIPNQGAGAAKLRIEAARRLFPSIWFNEKKTEAGREALGWYHEKRDENRLIGLGPNHDWSSHAADAFGLMCICYEHPYQKKQDQRYSKSQSSSTSWMAW
ncbi:PBSX family phage terminase large subunit [Bartonella tamiae]|uniref:PBSX family phage terminase large subunit n=1 Tax=Bartonella tamiae TaxID=373638 RepID=UPI00026E77AE|nr:phage terminase large subunit [Bartonella tamiae]EJF92653.1 PBSX family phage terminase, large subunit [Bartonella tamiae Th307]